MMDVVVTTGAVNVQSFNQNCHHQQTNTHLFTGPMPVCRKTNCVTALKGKNDVFKQAEI